MKTSTILIMIATGVAAIFIVKHLTIPKRTKNLEFMQKTVPQNPWINLTDQELETVTRGTKQIVKGLAPDDPTKVAIEGIQKKYGLNFDTIKIKL